jgi:hypothetical protein
MTSWYKSMRDFANCRILMYVSWTLWVMILLAEQILARNVSDFGDWKKNFFEQRVKKA